MWVRRHKLPKRFETSLSGTFGVREPHVICWRRVFKMNSEVVILQGVGIFRPVPVHDGFHDGLVLIDGNGVDGVFIIAKPVPEKLVDVP